MSPNAPTSTSLSYFNIIYIILGYYLFVVGLIYFQSFQPIFDHFDDDQETLDTILLLDAGRGVTSVLVLFFLICGMVMMAIGLQGICAAVSRGVCQLRTFATFLTLLSMAKLIMGGAMMLVSFHMLLPLQLWGYMTINFMKMSSDENSARAQVFLQYNYDCCGVNNYTDYYRVFNNDTELDMQGADNCTSVEEIKMIGCEEKISELYFCRWRIMGTVALSIAILEIIGAVLAHRFARRCSKRKVQPVRPEYYLDEDFSYM